MLSALPADSPLFTGFCMVLHPTAGGGVGLTEGLGEGLGDTLGLGLGLTEGLGDGVGLGLTTVARSLRRWAPLKVPQPVAKSYPVTAV